MRKLISVLLICVLVIAGFAVAAHANPAAYVTYAQFGAVGDGETCDFDAIIAAHAYANEHGLPVRVNAGTFYIGESGRTAIIQTSTDWTGASFIINNTNVPAQERHAASGQFYRYYNIFEVRSALPIVDRAAEVDALYVGMENVGITFAQPAFIVARDQTTRHFTRPGAPDGAAMTDVFIVDEAGNVCETTPIVWDFSEVTEFFVHPIDAETLYITGGEFNTIEAMSGRNGPFYRRGIDFQRSNVVLDGLVHNLVNPIVPGDETGRGWGLVQIIRASGITVQNSMLAGRVGYDIFIESSANILFYHVEQTNCIHNRNYWGITGTHRNKNMVFDSVALSRIGSHQGVHNLTIRNSEVGWSGIPTTGSGTLLLENTTVSSFHLVTLRETFGSSWRGEFVIRDVVFRPTNTTDVALFRIDNNGRNHFGFQAALPTTVCINGLVIDDAHLRTWRSRFPLLYLGPNLFSANHVYGNDALGITLLWDWLTVRRNAPYRIQITQDVSLRNVEVTSGRRLRTSRSVLEFRNTNLTWRCPCAS